jgi:hypothetical protein
METVMALATLMLERFADPTLSQDDLLARLTDYVIQRWRLG